MTTTAPRAVFVTRETDYELLLARHATREQARFYLDTRGQKLAELEARHEQFQSVLRQARAAVPDDWRQTLVRRADLDRFLFAPEDVIVAVGQDGLVANVAKYLTGQPVLGVNPAPDLYDGVLVRVELNRLGAALPACLHGDVAVENRTMVEGVLDTGEKAAGVERTVRGASQPPIGEVPPRDRRCRRRSFLERPNCRLRHGGHRLGALDHGGGRTTGGTDSARTRGWLFRPRAIPQLRDRHHASCRKARPNGAPGHFAYE